MPGSVTRRRGQALARAGSGVLPRVAEDDGLADEFGQAHRSDRLGRADAVRGRVRRARPRPGSARPRRGFTARHPAWPVTSLLFAYPLWWALGLADFMWIILAFPMICQLVAWHTSGIRRLRMPPGFGIWMIFLVVALIGIAAISLTAPGTVPSPVSHRVLSYVNRMSDYGGATILLLYAGNLTESELSRRRLAWLLGLVGVVTVAGGLAGIILPHLQFDSPLLHLLPKSARANPYIQASMQPGLSQVQNVLGSPGGRPKAPFDYTNTWGDCLTILLPYLIIGWWHRGSRRERYFAAGVLVLAIVPLLYSLNRGAWIGVGISVAYLAVRFAAKGKTALLGGLCAVIAIAALLIILTPLKGVVIGRIHNGKSNNLRGSLSSLSVTDGLASPLIGFGDTRQERGSPNSIAIGPSLKCPTCGQLAVGSTGQLWLLLICNGLLGTVCYLGFFAYGIWRYRHDQSPEALVGVLVLLLSFVYMFTYDATGAPLGFTMLAYALMWKGATYQREQAGPARPALAIAR